MAFPTWIVGMVLFAFANLVGAKKRIGPGTIRVRPAASFQDKMLTRSPRWHDALTQLTAKHANEPGIDFRGGSCPERVVRPVGAGQMTAAHDQQDRGDENRTDRPVNLLAEMEETGPKRRKMALMGIRLRGL